MNYYALRIQHSLSEIEQDLLIDGLAQLGFDSFETSEPAEVPSRLSAYIPEPDYTARKGEIDALLNQPPYSAGIVNREEEFIKDQDWNAVWESQYEPVKFGDFCFVHAPFHAPDPSVQYNIEIEPKMSFGTAHHPTTSLMIKFLEQEPPLGKRVLDMGCGTGVLGILAAMQGAGHVTGIDIDEWAYRNALENTERNGMSERMQIEMGDAGLLPGRSFDLVIANINRNILTRDMAVYADTLNPGGVIYLSGFYRQDMEIIENECNARRLFYQRHLEQGDWVAVKFIKK